MMAEDKETEIKNLKEMKIGIESNNVDDAFAIIFDVVDEIDGFINEGPSFDDDKFDVQDLVKSFEILLAQMVASVNARIDFKTRTEAESRDFEGDEDLVVAELDDQVRDTTSKISKTLGGVHQWFAWQSEELKWAEYNQHIQEQNADETNLESAFETENTFYRLYLPHNSLKALCGEYIDYKWELPSAKTFLETIMLTTIGNLHGTLQSMFFFQSISKNYDLERFLKPLPEIENFNQFGEMLVSKSHLLATEPFEISAEESDEMNDLLARLISTQSSFLSMLRQLEIGGGPYKPVLSDANSHVVIYEARPRTAYANLPIWPSERERWSKMEELDISNWVGEKYHKEILGSSIESHRVLYRDFLNYIQKLGFVHKKVTAYDNEHEHRRVQPQSVSYMWGGEKQKYRPNASIYFYIENCPISGREMRISVDSSMRFNMISINVGLEFFRDYMETTEVLDIDSYMLMRESAEKYCANLLDGFETFQKEHGLLKNSKFNSLMEELNLKGRTFSDLLLSSSKKQLLDDNIFAILNNSEAILRRGVETNRGIILAGPPGVGKSLTIDAIVHEGKCTVLYADFKMLHKDMDLIFKIARKYAPTILILEDIDALGITGQRGVTSGGSGLSTLLNNMDGINSNNGVITIATSNHPESLDWALIARPGRFDVRIDYPYPGHELLRDIFNLKLKPFPKEKGLKIDKIVKKMPLGFTGSHIQDIVNQANYISINEANSDVENSVINQRAIELAFERSLYNFNKFLSERPHIKLESAPDASEILMHNDSTDGFLLG